LTFAKMVILKTTTYTEVEEVCERLREMMSDRAIPLILQLVTPEEGIEAPTFEQLVKMSEIASCYIRSVYVLPQVHRYMGWR